MAGGRPSLWKPEYADQAFRLCLLGHTNKDLAHYFKVGDSTIDKWIATIPEFSSALKAGRDDADNQVVQSLFRTAMGIQVGPDGEEIRVPPNVTAMIFWLKNRQIGRWRDRVDQDVKITHRTLAEELADINGKPSPDRG